MRAACNSSRIYGDSVIRKNKIARSSRMLFSKGQKRVQRANRLITRGLRCCINCKTKYTYRALYAVYVRLIEEGRDLESRLTRLYKVIPFRRGRERERRKEESSGVNTVNAVCRDARVWMNTMSSIDSMKLAVRRESNPRWNESFQLKANDRVYVAIQDAKYAVSSSKRSFYDFHGLELSLHR